MVFAGSSAMGVTIDNGIAGDGRWQVNALAGGETFDGRIDPTGATGITNVVWNYGHYVDVGADGAGVNLGLTTIVTPAALTGPGEVTSTGYFLGGNATINWSADSTIAPGSPIYQTTLTFDSAQPFGTVRVIQYLDEDVFSSSNNLIVVGTPGAADFQLLTVDDFENVGVAQAAGYLTATGATYIGWHGATWPSLIIDIVGGGTTYSIPGIVTLNPIVDLRYPGLPAYGTQDIGTAIAFDLNPNATQAVLQFALGGSPSGAPVPDPTVPEPGSVAILTGIAAAALLRRRRN